MAIFYGQKRSTLTTFDFSTIASMCSSGTKRKNYDALNIWSNQHEQMIAKALAFLPRNDGSEPTDDKKFFRKLLWHCRDAKGSKGSRCTYWWSRIRSSSATPFPWHDICAAERSGSSDLCARDCALSFQEVVTQGIFDQFLLQVAANLDSSLLLLHAYIRPIMCHVCFSTEWMVVDRSVDICLILGIRFSFTFGAFDSVWYLQLTVQIFFLSDDAWVLILR